MKNSTLIGLALAGLLSASGLAFAQHTVGAGTGPGQDVEPNARKAYRSVYYFDFGVELRAHTPFANANLSRRFEVLDMGADSHGLREDVAPHSALIRVNGVEAWFQPLPDGRLVFDLPGGSLTSFADEVEVIIFAVDNRELGRWYGQFEF